jgi:hypothetical protein
MGCEILVGTKEQQPTTTCADQFVFGGRQKQIEGTTKRFGRGLARYLEPSRVSWDERDSLMRLLFRSHHHHRHSQWREKKYFHRFNNLNIYPAKFPNFHRSLPRTTLLRPSNKQQRGFGWRSLCPLYNIHL